MGKYRPSGSAEISDRDDAARVAESVRSDFSDLISILDQQLANLSDSEDRTRAHLLEAKAAANRGLGLSKQSVELLRAAK